MTTLAPVKDPNAHHDSPVPSIPCSRFHHVLWVWQQVGGGTCASGAGDERLRRMDDSLLLGDSHQHALCRALFHRG
jgi:hypothetical protein